ncbi:hydroxysqualene dehydroxylase HpnE [Leekyejoonella antrihumi]|uniref:FAD-dependent oxidoreductase n=1 Tax=Leekyejoonella antrihumi TaxID=1660198 RepID=A0A563E541_9MICO|nr:hydroxysqualene dehydroxylase HpnE [Leekyejoonella antrihumi]TWP37678.1 FAD-dependent oxidoreductase [Leekyejoonella antrihumi]
MATVGVIGGGLAGITAALDLADAGHHVILLESRSRLGGLTNSFQREGLWVDNGQHVFLRCCTSYRQLLERLGVEHQVQLQPQLTITMRSGSSGRGTRIHRTSLPSPLHLGGALLAHRWIPLRERLQAARVALALGRVDRDASETDDVSFGDWLRQQGCSPRAVETLWDLVGLATLNAHADQASLALAATVFQLGLLGDKGGADIGWATVPLQQLHGAAALRALDVAGAEVCTRSRVRAVTRTTSGWRVDLDDTHRTFDRLVVAVPPDIADGLVGSAALRVPADFVNRLGRSPIVNLHVVIDRQVMSEPFLAAVDSPLQWLFDRTTSSGLPCGQYLVASLSAADDLIGCTVAELRTTLLPEFVRILPRMTDATVQDFFVTREPHATFRPAPGTALSRPAARTALPGLAVAGAWTATGWPATMEGAVRSGHAAASALQEHTPARRDEVAA